MRLLSVCRAKSAACVNAAVDLYAVAKLLWQTGRNMYKAKRMGNVTKFGSAAQAKKRLGD